MMRRIGDSPYHRYVESATLSINDFATLRINDAVFSNKISTSTFLSLISLICVTPPIVDSEELMFRY
jgi:hypothetical protein